MKSFCIDVDGIVLDFDKKLAEVAHVDVEVFRTRLDYYSNDALYRNPPSSRFWVRQVLDNHLMDLDPIPELRYLKRFIKSIKDDVKFMYLTTIPCDQLNNRAINLGNVGMPAFTIVPSGEDKVNRYLSHVFRSKLNSTDILIDDRLENAIDWANNGGICVLLNTSYNRTTNEGEEQRIIRIDSLQELEYVYNYILDNI